MFNWKRAVLLSLILFALAALCACAGDERKPIVSLVPDNSVAITFDFLTQSGYASNQFAVWVEDENGQFIRTLFATRFTASGGYEKRAEAIPTWVERSGLANMQKADMDAVSGATPKTGTLTYTWDLKDDEGDEVPPGLYTFYVEGSLRWKNRVLYQGVIEIGDRAAAAQAEAQYFYEGTEDSPALGDTSSENMMIGPVKAEFTPTQGLSTGSPNE